MAKTIGIVKVTHLFYSNRQYFNAESRANIIQYHICSNGLLDVMRGYDDGSSFQREFN